MIELFVLGKQKLKGIAAEDADALLTRKKNVALLVYLASAQRHEKGSPHYGYSQRDKLVGLLWPELTQDGARAALRKALFELRERLGKEVFVTRGDEEIALSATCWCDVAAYERAIEDKHYARALELFRDGNLLDGVFITGAGAYQDWLDTKRTELLDMASAAAWSLAAQCADDEAYTNANKWARLAAKYAPGDERMLCRVMLFLEKHHDVAGALYVYEDFLRRLQRDFGKGVNPSPATQAIYNRLRGTSGRL